MKPSRDPAVLISPSLVDVGQPGPDVCQVGRTRPSVREREENKGTIVRVTVSPSVRRQRENAFEFRENAK